MANRSNHYEAAFEAFLRQRRIPYVAVDEAKRSLWGGCQTLKSLDFIVSPSQGGLKWLVDVKGRNFPAGRQRQCWRNWSTEDDLASLSQWEHNFGQHFSGLFVFAYRLTEDIAPLPQEELFPFRENLYAFVAIRLAEYSQFARTLSRKWGTVSLPTETFRRLAEPATALLY